jgi:hypothetical protein
VTPTDDGGATVELEAPEEAIAPGQACVFYRDSRVLGGGWIKAAETVVGSLLSSSGKPSEDIFPRQRLRRAGEESQDQDVLSET